MTSQKKKPKKKIKEERWYKFEDNDKTTWAKGKDGVKFYHEQKKMDKFMFDMLKPGAYYDDEYDMVYIAFNGGRGVEHTVETHTTEGKVIRFDFDKKQNIVGVEIEGLISTGEKNERNK